MRNIFLLITLSLFLSGCQTTKFIEKYSEPLSQSVWATSDGIDAGRFDLAAKYSKLSTQLVPPPKERIQINPLVKRTPIQTVDNKIVGNSTPTSDVASELHYVVIPDALKTSQVISVGSSDFSKLAEDATISAQITKENLDLKNQIAATDNQQKVDADNNNKLLIELNYSKIQIEKQAKVILQKEITIWKWRGVALAFVLLIAGYIYLKVQKRISLPWLP